MTKSICSTVDFLSKLDWLKMFLTGKFLTAFVKACTDGIDAVGSKKTASLIDRVQGSSNDIHSKDNNW